MSKYYFFDNSFLSLEKNTVTKLAVPEKNLTNQSWVDPMQSHTRTDIPDWEYRVSILYPFVIYDETGVSVDKISSAKYKMWYEASAIPNYDTGRRWLDFIIDKENSRGVDLGDFVNTANGSISRVHPDFHFALCYMESNDGINWKRPDCGEFYYKKQDGSIVGTNIVFIGEHGEGVVKNTHPLAGTREPAFLFACAHDGVAISSSNDGIHWEKPIRVFGEYDSKVQVRGDSQNHLYWSKEASRYVIITRGIEFDKSEPLRTVLTIPGPRRLCDESGNTVYAEGGFVYPFTALGGPLDAQPYSMPIFRLSDGYYIGLVSVFNCDEKSDDPFHVHASLAWSRDLINWKYLDGYKPFIANDSTLRLERGNDFGMIYCASPVLVDGKLRIYYAAVPEAHYWEYGHIPEEWRRVVDEAIPRSKTEKQITRTTSLNYATVEIDRFAGLYSDDGSVRTKPIRCKTDGITLSADALGGELQARLLDKDGAPIKGFDFEDFEPIRENVTEHKLFWRGDSELIKDTEIVLELSLHGATVYSVESDGERKSTDGEEDLPPLIPNHNQEK